MRTDITQYAEENQKGKTARPASQNETIPCGNPNRTRCYGATIAGIPGFIHTSGYPQSPICHSSQPGRIAGIARGHTKNHYFYDDYTYQ